MSLGRLRRILVRRLRWHDAGETSEAGVGRPMIARLFAYLFGLGALLLLGTLLLAGERQREPFELALVAAGALIAVLLIVVFDRTPLWLLRVMPGVGTILVGFAIYYAGPVASVAYAMYLAWVVVAASLFFESRLVLLHGALAIGVYAFVLGLRETPGETAALQIAMTAGTVAAVAVVMGGIAGQQRAVLARLGAAASTDPLTGLLNRRALAEAFERELSRAERGGQSVGLVILDLDGFKRFNDRNGHPAGDKALRRLGYVLGRTTRAVDHVARIGGEEFAILAPESDTAGTLALAERLRRAIEIEFSESDQLTASCGVASFPGNGNTRPELVVAADRALYDAKARGRNMAVASTATPKTMAATPGGSA